MMRKQENEHVISFVIVFVEEVPQTTLNIMRRIRVC